MNTAPITIERLTAPNEVACPFCSDLDRRVETALGTMLAIRDQYPVTVGHTLVIPRRHVSDFFDLSVRERRDADQLVDRVRRVLIAEDPTIDGFNIGINCGAAAGQTVPHAHIHLIPRRRGDVRDPRGGVRGVIADRMKY